MPPAEHPHGQVDYNRVYKLRSILDESRGRYLIEWEDDEVTGESYEPTWEPKRNANKVAVEDWKRRKAQLISTAATTSKRKKGKSRKVVPAAAIFSTARNSPNPSAHQQEQVLENDSSSRQDSDKSVPEIVESPKTAGTGAIGDFNNSIISLVEPIVQPFDSSSGVRAGVHKNSINLDEQTARGQPQRELFHPFEEQPKALSALVNSADSPPSTTTIPDSQTLIEKHYSNPVTATTEHVLAVSPSSGLQKVPTTSQRTVSFAGAAPVTATTEELSSPIIPAKLHQSRGQSLLPSEYKERRSEEVASTVETQYLSADSLIPQTAGQLHSVSLSITPDGVTSTSAEEANLQNHDPDQTHFRTHLRKGFRVTSPTTSNIQASWQSVPQLDQGTPAKELSPSSPIHVTNPFVTASLENSFPVLTQVERPLDNDIGTSTQFRNQELSDNGSIPRNPSPSRSVGTFRESVPPCFVSYSLSSLGSQSLAAEMESSQDSANVPLSLPDKLAASRAERHGSATKKMEPADLSIHAPQAAQEGRASIFTHPPKLISSLIAEEQAEEQARRSPSAIPAVKPLPRITQEEQNTSERYETLLPHVQGVIVEDGRRADSMGGSGTLSRQQSQTQPSLGLTHRHLPLALIGHQRDQYSSMVWYHKDLIERFLATHTSDAELSSEIDYFVERMRRITLHPDLDNAETLTQYDVQPTQQAEWDVNCCAKFRFLRDLFAVLQRQNLHVTIISRPGRIIGMLDTFLTGISVPHRRATDIASGSLCSDRDSIIVTVISVEDDVRTLQVQPVDLFIAVDPAIIEDHLYMESLTQICVPLPIILTLVVQGSVEHIELSVSMALSRRNRMHAIVSGIWQYRDKVGRLEEEQLKFEAAANSIATYFATHKAIEEWPIPPLVPLTELDSQTDSDSDHMPISDGPSNSNSKRRFEETNHFTNSADVFNKKARFDETADADHFLKTVNPQDIEIMRVSDSVTKPTQVSISAETSSVCLRDNELHLQRMLNETQERLAEHVQALMDLQYRNEEQREKLIEASNQRDIAIASAQEAMARSAELQNRVTTLKAERTELKQQLEDVKMRLLDHSVPERAQYEALRLELEQAKRAKEHLEQRLESARKEAEYSREMYQSSSQSAQNLASQNAELEKELATARNRATGEQVRLRQMGYDAQAKRLRDENQKLKVLLKDREAGLKFRDEEISRLKEASRGRMSTRGSSVPRSPRLGSPMKLDGFRSRSSRQGSPATGELKAKAALLHPLRNG